MKMDNEYKHPDFLKFCEELLEKPLIEWQKKILDEVYDKCRSVNGISDLKLLPFYRGDGYSMTKLTINTLMMMYENDIRGINIPSNERR